MKTIIHVNQHIIKANRKSGAHVWIGSDDPVKVLK